MSQNFKRGIASQILYSTYISIIIFIFKLFFFNYNLIYKNNSYENELI